MAALPELITVAQFRELPEGGEFAYELHHGEVVRLTRPKGKHIELQHRLLAMLAARIPSFGVVRIEYPYRAIVEYDLRAADVAAISHQRWASMDLDDNLYGAPDLVIEVKSPSNSRRQLQELVAVCLANGSAECWIVDPDTKSISVLRRDETRQIYNPGDTVPLKSFGAAELSVDEVFAGL